MIARKLLWIVEICWGTASNFRTCKVRHSTSSSLFSLSLYFLFFVPLMILLSWFKFVNVLHIYLFISNDWKGLYKKKLFNWIIERIKLCDCVFSIFAMPPVHENFQMWSYHHHYRHHHFLWSILIMVFGGFWGIYIENFLLGRFKKNEAHYKTRGGSGCVFLGRVAQNCLKPRFLKTGLKDNRSSRVF